MQEIVQGIEEDNEQDEQVRCYLVSLKLPWYWTALFCKQLLYVIFALQLTWSKKIHCVILYKVLCSHYEKTVEDHCIQLVQEITDDIQYESTEFKRIDSQDVLSGILPPVNLSLYFNLLKECNWFDFFTEVRFTLIADL